MPSSFVFNGKGSLYLYKATYTIAGWSGDATNGFTQTVTPEATESNFPPINAQTQLSPPMMKSSGVKDTDKALMKTLNLINAGVSSTTDAGTVTTKVWEQPTTDIVVYWYGNWGVVSEQQ